MLQIENYDSTKKEYRLKGRKEVIVGVDEKMLQLFSLINRLTHRPTSIIIRGESGTGKDLVAKALHFNGFDGTKKPFVTMNCSAVPPTLFESILFGSIKGAYTDSKQDKKGILSTADGGTLFLDEIGDMPLQLQPKLLKVVEEKTYTPVGSTELLSSNFRLLTATNKNLEEEVRKGSFRSDLLFRINTFSLNIPPLRERQEDIEFLSNHWIKIFNREYVMNIPPINVESLGILINHEWPGNVRELRSVIERVFVVSDDNRKEPIRFEEIHLGGKENVMISDSHGIWYEKGVLPFPLKCIEGMKGAKSQGYLHNQTTLLKNKKWYHQSFGGRGGSDVLLTYLTSDNLRFLFDDTNVEDFKTLEKRITSNPFNQIIQRPFAVCSPSDLIKDARECGFGKAVLSYPQLIKAVSKESVPKIEGCDSPTLFVITPENMSLFISRKKDQEQLNKFNQYIQNKYQTFKSWRPN